jgi:xanthine dehydrogenase accessory factor
VAAKEVQEIIDAHKAAVSSGEAAALVTVVKTEGSTYRRAGARMWIGSGGRSVGSISGGCLEDDVRDRAQEVIANGKPALIQYDTTAEGDILWGSGVGCQGVVHVLVEPLAGHTEADPLTKSCASALNCVAEGLRTRQPAVLATVFRVENSAHAYPGEFLWRMETFPVDGNVAEDQAKVRFCSRIADSALGETVLRIAREVLRKGVARVQACVLPKGGRAEIFFDLIRPPQALLIVGAGHDAVPLAHLAGELGWRVRIADRRRAYAIRERFPTAQEVIHCKADEIGGDRLPIETGEAIVVMTHNYLEDVAILRAVLPTPAGYIGLLGPARRKGLLLRDLALAARDETGTAAAVAVSWTSPGSLRRVHGPAGLDIGAETAEQIALSILAEIEAYATRRQGGSLKCRRRPLHDVILESDGISGKDRTRNISSKEPLAATVAA